MGTERGLFSPTTSTQGSAMSLSDEDVAAVADAVAAKLGAAPGDLLTMERAAERLGVSNRTVRKMCDNGTLRSFKVEGRRVLRPEVVDAYIAAREAEEAA